MRKQHHGPQPVIKQKELLLLGAAFYGVKYLADRQVDKSPNKVWYANLALITLRQLPNALNNRPTCTRCSIRGLYSTGRLC